MQAADKLRKTAVASGQPLGQGAAASPQAPGEAQPEWAWAGAGQGGQAWAAGAPPTARSALLRGWTWAPWGQAWGRAWWVTHHGAAAQGLAAGEGGLPGLAAQQEGSVLQAEAKGGSLRVILCVDVTPSNSAHLRSLEMLVDSITADPHAHGQVQVQVLS